MTPIEQACRALCELEGNLPGATFEGRPMWESYLPQARAVLAAIRDDPSDAMMTAAINKGQEVGYTDVIAVWRAMVDAAGR